jgi:hypothetical protein
VGLGILWSQPPKDTVSGLLSLKRPAHHLVSETECLDGRAENEVKLEAGNSSVRRRRAVQERKGPFPRAGNSTNPFNQRVERVGGCEYPHLQDLRPRIVQDGPLELVDEGREGICRVREEGVESFLDPISVGYGTIHSISYIGSSTVEQIYGIDSPRGRPPAF